MKIKLFAVFFLLTGIMCRAGSEVPVIITAGQSNADGRVPIAELPSYIHYDYCRWSYGSGDFLKATGKFTEFWPTVGRTDIGPRWGFDAVVYYNLEQRWKRPFYVIKQTMGGTAIDTACTRSTHGMFWSADPEFVKSDKSLLRSLTRQIDACLENLPEDYDIKFMLWHQGEGDMSQADRYYDNMKAVTAYIRQHLVEATGRSKYATLPIVCGTFAKNSRQGSPKVADALRRLAEEDENFHVVEAGDLSLQSDRIHFDALGAETLGKRFFEKIMEII